jgi:hypothetical protein
MERVARRRAMTQREFDWQIDSASKRNEELSIDQVNAAVKATAYLLPIRVRSQNTSKAYRSAIRYFAAWHVLRFGLPLDAPFSTEVVLQFLRDHVKQSANLGAASVEDFAFASKRDYGLPEDVERQLMRFGFKRVRGSIGEAQLRMVLAALIRGRRDSKWFPARPDIRFFSREDLFSMREFQQLMDTRAFPERPAQVRHRPITADLFACLIATCGGTTRDRRDKALLYFAWNGGGLKAQDIVAARIDDLHDDGVEIHYCCKFAAPGRWGIRFQGLVRTYGGPAAQAIRDWMLCLATMNIEEGALWRRPFKGGSPGTALAVSAIGQIVRERARLAGLAAHEFSSRSLAQGQLEALLADIPLKASEAEQRVRELSRSTIRSVLQRRRNSAATSK